MFICPFTGLISLIFTVSPLLALAKEPKTAEPDLTTTATMYKSSVPFYWNEAPFSLGYKL